MTMNRNRILLATAAAGALVASGGLGSRYSTMRRGTRFRAWSRSWCRRPPK